MGKTFLEQSKKKTLVKNGQYFGLPVKKIFLLSSSIIIFTSEKNDEPNTETKIDIFPYYFPV